MYPLLRNIGLGFSGWDSIVSWNRWALEFYNNKYIPIDAAYPTLLPAIWSLIYKVQNTSDIWWTAQFTLVVLPVSMLVLLWSLYFETKHKAFIIFSLVVYPYLISPLNTNGYMDMPVMIAGTLSLALLLAAEIYKEKKEFLLYLYASLLFAGIASIIKQAGFMFIFFDIAYIVINFKQIQQRKQLGIVLIISFTFFLTFLAFYRFHTSYLATENFHHLKNLSKRNWSDWQHIKTNLQGLFDVFFSTPGYVEWLRPILKPISLKLITPYLILFGFITFLFKMPKGLRALSFLSALFFLIGIALWIQFFSYDARNSYWVKSFFILFFSINAANFIMRYEYYLKKYFFIILFIVSVIYTLSIKKSYPNNVQKSFQENLVGTKNIALYMAKALKEKSSCVKVYTNLQVLPFNYYMNPYRDRFIINRIEKFTSLYHVNHDCPDGRYIVLRKKSRLYPQWRKVVKFVEDKYLIVEKQIDDHFVFFVPPNLHLNEKYLDQVSRVVPLKVTKYLEDVLVHLDKYRESTTMIHIFGWAFVSNRQVDHSKKYMVLQNKDHQFIIATQSSLRKDITKHFYAKDLNHAGFEAYIYKKDFPNGKYSLSILLIDEEGKAHMKNLGYTIDINN
jgi:hypothetical protein